MRRLVVVMGPSGAGKSRIGAALAQELDAPFFEGDAFHSDSNVAKMRAGSPLTDADREAWVEAILNALAKDSAPVAVLACSALTPFVQGRLRTCASHAPVFLLLYAPREVLAKRIAGRKEHFMPASLLDSQLEALEPPVDGIVINTDAPLAVAVRAAMFELDD